MSELEKRSVDEQFTDSLLDNPFGELKPAESQVNEVGAKSIIQTLPVEHQEKAKHIASQVSVTNQQAIMQFGVSAQNELSKFAEVMLEHVKEDDTAPIGKIIKDLMDRINEIKPEELEENKKGLFKKVFGSFLKKAQDLYKRYQRIDVEIEKISDSLEGHKKILTKDVLMLDKYFEKNKSFFDALNIYIAAGEYKLDELLHEELPKLKQKAETSENQMYMQELNDLNDFINRFEKRIHDLKLSRQISIQTAPQIRMIQQTNQALVEKIQSSVLTTIPLWKNQVAIALSMSRQKQALEAQKHVSQTTNELLKRNSEMLKTNSIEAARENERGIVDIETLKQTQSNLMTTLEETLKIQQDGRSKRMEAEQSLGEMEQELKTFLLELKR